MEPDSFKEASKLVIPLMVATGYDATSVDEFFAWHNDDVVIFIERG
jgi:hypothetical protein